MVRLATCLFADLAKEISDEAGRSVISSLRTLHPSLNFPPTPWDSPPPPPADKIKGCMAAFLVTDESNPLNKPLAVSLGIGTKFLSPALLEEDINRGVRIHDGHAEVLARRGLKKWLMRQIELAKQGHPSALQPDDNGHGYEMKNGLNLHFYCSSCPCGNASLRRWAQAGKDGGPSFDSLPPHLWPAAEGLMEHSLIGLQAIKEGQIQLLVKGGTNQQDSSNLTCDRKGTIPPGCGIIEETSPPSQSLILTCSDKIAVWNALGYQGALLSEFITRRIVPTSITVDRKFSREHLRRALCCRIQKWQHPTTREKVHHPILLCPSESISNNHHILASEPEEDDKAEFGDLCVVWWEGCDSGPDSGHDSGPVAINGRTGMGWINNESTPVSKRALLESYLELKCDHELKDLPFEFSQQHYHSIKKVASISYFEAKKDVFLSPNHFAPAVRTRGHPGSSSRRITSGYCRKEPELYRT